MMCLEIYINQSQKRPMPRLLGSLDLNNEGLGVLLVAEVDDDEVFAEAAEVRMTGSSRSSIRWLPEVVIC